MKLPTIEQVQAAHSITANDGYDEFGKALNRLQNWGRLANKLDRRGNLTEEEADLICWIRVGMSQQEFDNLPLEKEPVFKHCKMSFTEWYELADMPVKTKQGWVDMETGIPFYGTEEQKVEANGVDIFVATGLVD